MSSDLSIPELGKVELWSVQDVQQWLAELELEDCKDAFKRRMIDGHALLALSEESLVLWSTDLKIKRRKQIAKLVQVIKQEKSNIPVRKLSNKAQTTSKPVIIPLECKKKQCDISNRDVLPHEPENIKGQVIREKQGTTKPIYCKSSSSIPFVKSFPPQMSPPVNQAPLPPIITRPKVLPPKPPMLPAKPSHLVYARNDRLKNTNNNQNSSESSRSSIESDCISITKCTGVIVDEDSYEIPNPSPESSGSGTTKNIELYEYENTYEAIPDSGYPDSEEYEVPLSPPVPTASMSIVSNENKEYHSNLPQMHVIGNNVPKLPYHLQTTPGYGSLSAYTADLVPVMVTVTSEFPGETIVPKPPRPPAPTPPAKRPLPPVPKSNSDNRISMCETEEDNIASQGWFHSVSRSRAEELVKLGVNGTFLVRESKHGGSSNPYTLTLLFESSVFNINIRLRPDSKYALGSSKPKEPSFVSVETLISYYQKKPIVLQRAGGPFTGKTILTTTPPR